MKKAISFAAVLIVIAAMVGALMWQRSREPEIEEIAATPTGRHLIQRTEAELVSVLFDSSDQTAVMWSFTDEDTGRTEWTWQDTDYLLDNAQTRHKIRSAFTLFANQVVHEDVNEVEGLNLADFGLDPPIMTITAEYTDGTTTNIYLGSPTIDFRGYFLMIEGDPGLFTISMLNAERFLFGLEDMIDVSLPIWHAESIEHIMISERGQATIEFVLEEHHEFEGFMWHVMYQPFPGHEVYPTSFEHHYFERFSAFTLHDLVNLHPEDFAVYGLDEPSLEFIYRAPHGEAHLLFGDVFMREIGGEEVPFIYVQFYGRPHVFEAWYDPISTLFGMNVLRFIERFISLVNISDVERIDILTPDTDLVVYINTVEDSTDIRPTINGVLVDDSEFRLVYRLIIGLSIDFEITPMAPIGEPLYTVRYTIFDGDDIELRFFYYDANFLAVSVDGADIWFVTNRRNFDMFIGRLSDMI